MLWPVKIPNQSSSTENILDFYSKITNVLRQASKDNIPYSKYNKHAKPYWSNIVKECHAEMLFRRGLWIAENRPRGMQFDSFRLYKKAKDVFRTNLQNAYLNYETDLYHSLDEACDIDHKTLWASLTKRKWSSSILSLMVNETFIRHPDDICTYMADHFSKVFSDTFDANFDNILNTT